MPAASILPELSEEDKAYLAGLFDTGGYLMFAQKGSSKIVRLQFSSGDEGLISAVSGLLKTGRSFPQEQETRKPCYVLVIEEIAAIYGILKNIRSKIRHTGKGQIADKIMAWVEQRYIIEVRDSAVMSDQGSVKRQFSKGY